jgi:hypothetical protein
MWISWVWNENRTHNVRRGRWLLWWWNYRSSFKLVNLRAWKITFLWIALSGVYNQPLLIMNLGWVITIVYQGRILVEIVGEVEKIYGRCSGLAHDPHGNIHVVYMYQCIKELWLYYSSNFALHYNCNKVSFKTLHWKSIWHRDSKHCIKRVFDTEMNDYQCSIWQKLYNLPSKPGHVMYCIK